MTAKDESLKRIADFDRVEIPPQEGREARCTYEFSYGDYEEDAAIFNQYIEIVRTNATIKTVAQKLHAQLANKPQYQMKLTAIDESHLIFPEAQPNGGTEWIAHCSYCSFRDNYHQKPHPESRLRPHKPITAGYLYSHGVPDKNATCPGSGIRLGFALVACQLCNQTVEALVLEEQLVELGLHHNPYGDECPGSELLEVPDRCF